MRAVVGLDGGPGLDPNGGWLSPALAVRFGRRGMPSLQDNRFERAASLHREALRSAPPGSGRVRRLRQSAVLQPRRNSGVFKSPVLLPLILPQRLAPPVAPEIAAEPNTEAPQTVFHTLQIEEMKLDGRPRHHWPWWVQQGAQCSIRALAHVPCWARRACPGSFRVRAGRAAYFGCLRVETSGAKVCGVKFGVYGRVSGAVLVGLNLVLWEGAALQAKPIRLRNQIIQDDPIQRTRLRGKAAANTSLNGLFLIQLDGTPRPETRAQLRNLGIELLRYVPEDAFVARFRAVDPGRLNTVSFVRWVGEFSPDYKVHHELRKHLGAQAAVPEHVRVAVLLSPDATAAQAGRVRAQMLSVRQECKLRCGTVLRGRIAPGKLRALAESDVVLWIEPERDMRLFDEVASKIVAGDGGPNRLYAQVLGYDGSGVAVAVADSGLNTGDAATMHPDLIGRTPVFFWYGGLSDAADEHGHGTHVAGIIAGDGATGRTDESGALYGLGVAPGALIIVQRIFDGFGNYCPPPSFEKLSRDATRAGAVIGSNSWGDDTHGRYDLSAMEFDELVRDADFLMPGDQPYILEFSAGNAGPAAQSVGSPAVAKNVIATGACQNDRSDLFIYDLGPEAMADFSSRGPCEDGRIKPDLVAPGTWIASLQSAAAGDENAWLPIDEYYQFQGGTSQAGPHVSGAAAVFFQFYRELFGGRTPSPALVKAALINAAVDLDNSIETEPVPNYDEGWGRVNLVGLLDPDGGIEYFDQTQTLTTGQVFEHRIFIRGPELPLKITLCYTDVPGFPAAVPALVNDLDLEAVAPDGTVYKGDQFNQGVSIPNPAESDRINNVEGVLVPAPVPGEWLVRVRAANVVADARVDTEDVDQDFALVISGCFAEPGEGIIVLDRAAYTAPDRINVRVVDTDLAGNSSLTVTVTSSTEPLGETLTLHPATASGTFTGAVVVAAGPPAQDGVLQVVHGDAIQVRYFDASAGVWVTANAVADLVPPQIFQVQLTNTYGQTLIKWVTDEPANSIVYFGTNSVLTHAVTNRNLDLDHAVALSGLIPGTTYYFAIVSIDAAGNIATNDNAGMLYRFVAVPSAPVLLIDSWLYDLLGDPPPLSGYTEALDMLGVQYDVWDVGINGSPLYENLRPYRAVIWRVPELLGVWSAAERAAISNYLYTGGGLFVASMEILSRLDEIGEANFIRAVLQVQSYTPDPNSTGAPEIIGQPNSGVGAGLDIALDYSIYLDLWSGLIGPDLSDTITPTTNASPVFLNPTGDVVGLRWPGVGQTAPGRLVLVTFPLDAVPLADGENDRAHLLRNVLNFLAPGWNTAPILTLDSASYTVPDIVSVELAGSVLAGAQNVTVSATTDSDTNGVTVALAKTQAGVFKGQFQLVNAANPPGIGQLRAKNGDIVSVRYRSGQNGLRLEATAAVDTIPPAISNVYAEAGYEDAVVYWDTSEPCDALVQYGESAFLNRTAYHPAFTTAHRVALFGLHPDKGYFYRVVSRDVAGNVTIDDNSGALYTLRTLQPVTPPWMDNMDSGAPGWVVFDNFAGFDELDRVGTWMLGVPNNGVETSAHSAPHAWGSNLNGDVIEFADCYLISPAIHLVGGNAATLEFWHSYDFAPEELEAGTLYLATSDATELTQLRTWYADASDGWELAQVDLTRYIGRVIYLIWNYQLFSLEDPPPPHPGWLIDDVSVTIESVPAGTIRITNNLWQARYVVTGPIHFTGRGLGTTITNAPAGQYEITFADVPFYQTPPAQTNTLTPGGQLLFEGYYTFTDANNNGISDAWEIANFGEVAPARLNTTDTDGDGMSDWAEFVAGTDPNNPLSPFRVSAHLLSGNTVRLDWSAVPTRTYRVLESTNGMNWTARSPWLTTSGTNLSFSFQCRQDALAHLFRIEVGWPNQLNPPPANLRLSANLVYPGNTVRLRWNCVPDRGYRVLGSSDLINWEPISDWIHPTAVTATYFVPLDTNSDLRLFRLEVRP